MRARFAAGDPAPGALKGLARGSDRLVDIGGVALGDLSDHSPSPWIERVERLAGDGVDPFAPDKCLVFAGEKSRRGFTEMRVDKRYIHDASSK